MTHRIHALLLAAGLALSVAAPAAAQPFDLRTRLTADDARDAVRGGRQRPLGELLPRVRAQVPGDLVTVVRLEDRGERMVYVLRWKTDDGRLLDLEVDAATGAVLR